MQNAINDKHETFCRSYLIDPETRFNATRTYMKIYPNASYKTALANGPRLLGKNRERIEKLILDKFSLGDVERVSLCLKGLLEAERPIKWRGKVIAHEPDHMTRLEGLKLLFVLCGYVKSWTVRKKNK